MNRIRVAGVMLFLGSGGGGKCFYFALRLGEKIPVIKHREDGQTVRYQPADTGYQM